MQTSRRTRLACSGLLSTSGMRFKATYVGPQFKPSCTCRAFESTDSGQTMFCMLICIFRCQQGSSVEFLLVRLGATSVKGLANTALCYPRMLMHH